jgi:exodeoxyribonuclease V alpha subunit
MTDQPITDQPMTTEPITDEPNNASARPDRRWPPTWARGLAGADAAEADVYLAIEAASWPVGLLPGERRAFALLVLASVQARGEGATRLRLAPPTELEARLERLGPSAEDRAAALALGARLLDAAALAPLVGRPGHYRPFIVDGAHLYQERDLRLETRLAQAIGARRAARAVPVAATGAGVDARPDAAVPGWSWTAAQSAALEAVRRERLTVVSGGPGSGKTALIGGILRAWMALGIPAEAIAIAAPTGKAANRIAEVLATEAPVIPTPGTLHRLLGFSAGRFNLEGGEFRYHENRRLPQAAVIVDEASMVGLSLLEQLTRALRPDARLVLLGDADQLPAIGAGSVFRDLGGLASRLTESHRMDPGDPAGANILEAARAIAQGKLAALDDSSQVTSPKIDRLKFSGFELYDPAAAAPAAAAPAAAAPAVAAPAGGATAISGRRSLSGFIDHWYATWLRPSKKDGVALGAVLGCRDGELDPAGAAIVASALDRHGRVRLLTVTRVGFTGADRINAALAHRAAEDADLQVAPDEIAPGTPVMMTENDYDRGLMNGDQGIVVRVASVPSGAPTSVAVFPQRGAMVTFPVATLRGSLAVAYAMTVHKAQGSELERAALILPELDLPLLSRELIYTAVTRARRSMVVVGRRALLEQAIGRPLVASSGLAERLAAHGALPEAGSQPSP